MGRTPPADPARLDPADAADEAEVFRLLEGAFVLSKDAVPFLLACAQRGASERVVAHASVCLGFHAYGSGQVEEGANHYRRGLRFLWGTGSRMERNACVNLASASAYQGRLLEALVLSRRGRMLAAGVARSNALLVATMALLRALAGLGDWERFGALRSEGEALLGALPDPTQEFNFHTVIVDAALIREDTEEAARHLEAAANLPVPMTEPRHFGLAWAQVHLLRGETAKAVARARAARRIDERDDQMDERLHAVEVLAAAAAGNIGAPQAARDFLDRLRGPLRSMLPPGRRMRLATQMARDVGERFHDRPLASRAYEVAGAAALERMGELEAFRVEFPEAQSLSVEDAAILDEYRERFLWDHGGILEAVRGLFRGEPEAVRGFRKARPGEIPVLRACAWCGHVRGPEGVWVDLGSSPLPVSGRVEVSHGICQPCQTRLLGLDQTA